MRGAGQSVRGPSSASMSRTSLDIFVIVACENSWIGCFHPSPGMRRMIDSSVASAAVVGVAVMAKVVGGGVVRVEVEAAAAASARGGGSVVVVLGGAKPNPNLPAISSPSHVSFKGVSVKL